MLAANLKRCLAPLTVVALAGCGGSDLGRVEVRPSQERRTPDGDRLYTPSTQSLLRGHSWMEDVDAVRIQADRNDNATVRMESQDGKHYVEIRNLPLRHIVPRLHYKPAVAPDDFDAFNLMLAEYSRNSISVPQGRAGDSMAHYQTNLTDTVPWRLAGDFEFEPNPYYRPLRMGMVNNCLRPGLWELNAVDRSGEIYHAWFDMPKDYYYRLVSDVNGLEEHFVKQALDWKEDEIPLDLDRLRTEMRSLGTVAIGVIDEEVSFSSQDSRRKLNKNYVRYEDGGKLRSPTRLSDLYQNKSVMSSFIEPGIYSWKEEDLNEFDFTFLATADSVEVKLVSPKTSYRWYEEPSSTVQASGAEYLELTINLADDEHIVIGNLPSYLLVKQEDFVLHGFGVGILSASGLAERRRFLLDRGPRPSYAYLAVRKDGRLVGLNSHGRGIEQIFVRSHPDDDPHWTVTITSYERIVDLVKYRIDMPDEIVEAQREASRGYISPIYLTYRDDNVN